MKKVFSKNWLWILSGIILTLVLIILLVMIRRKKLKSLTTPQTLEEMENLTQNSYADQNTWDSVTDKRIDRLHPLIRAKVKEFIIRTDKELGIKLRITDGLRTIREQDKIYAQGRTTPGKIVTMAPGGKSYHNYGLAIDVVEIKDGKANYKVDYKKVADLAKKIGFEWGGDFKSITDKPHFQWSFGLSIAQLMDKHKNNLYTPDGFIKIS